jgi:ribonucleotide reductase alpha subunit
MAGASGKKLDDTYKLAWLRGLKTTYYLRTTSATQAEKSTISSGRLNAVPSSHERDGGLQAGRGAGARARARRHRGSHRHPVLRHRRSRLRGLSVIAQRPRRAMRCLAATHSCHSVEFNVHECFAFRHVAPIIGALEKSC